MSVRLRQISDKSLANYTVPDVATFNSPSVEDHLVEIRRALALATVLHDAQAHVAADRAGLAEELEQDAATALAELLDHAWLCASELTDGLPGDVQNLRVTTDLDSDSDPSRDPSVVERLHALCKTPDDPEPPAA